MDEIFPKDPYRVSSELDGALGRLGVDITYWMDKEIREPKHLEPAFVGPIFEILKRKYSFLKDYSDEAKSAPVDVFLRRVVQHQIEEGVEAGEITIALEDEQFNLLHVLRDAALPGYMFALVKQADRWLMRENREAALASYQQALDECFGPRLQIELGCLYLYRATAKERVASPPEPFVVSPVEFDSGAEAAILDGDLLAQPVAEHGPTRTALVELALQAYGRAYGHFTSEPYVDQAVHSRDLDDLFVYQCLALDGLRAVFQATDKPDLALRACDVYELWRHLLSQRGVETDSFFDHRFVFVRGLEAGRDLERQVQAAIEEARRTEVVSDPDAFADDVATRVLEGLKDRSPQGGRRAEAEQNIKTRLGSRVSKIPPQVFEWLVEAETSAALSVGPATRLGLVALYAKVVEGLLRHSTGAGTVRLGEFLKATGGGAYSPKGAPLGASADRGAYRSQQPAKLAPTRRH